MSMRFKKHNIDVPDIVEAAMVLEMERANASNAIVPTQEDVK